MNLRVDLILKSEQRSPNVVSLRNLRRVAPILVPFALFVLASTVAVNILELRNRVRMAETLWQEAEPRKIKAIKLRARADENEAIINELNGWKRSRIEWHTQLEALQQAIRPDMQLESLQVNQAIQIVDDKYPARAFTLLVAGIATGPNAEGDVQSLTAQLRQGPSFAEWVSKVNVVKYDADPRNKANRVFQMECIYKPLKFHETPRKQTGPG